MTTGTLIKALKRLKVQTGRLDWREWFESLSSL